MGVEDFYEILTLTLSIERVERGLFRSSQIHLIRFFFSCRVNGILLENVKRVTLVEDLEILCIG